MSVFKHSKSYIVRQLESVPEEERDRKRLELDLAAILTGPTSGYNATKLSVSALAASTAGEIAQAMKEASDRYLTNKE